MTAQLVSSDVTGCDVRRPYSAQTSHARTHNHTHTHTHTHPQSLSFPSLCQLTLTLHPWLQVSAVCIVLGLVAIGYCAELRGARTLQDAVHAYTGAAGLVVCNTLIFTHNMGACVALLIVVGDQIDRGELRRPLVVGLRRDCFTQKPTGHVHTGSVIVALSGRCAVPCNAALTDISESSLNLLSPCELGPSLTCQSLVGEKFKANWLSVLNAQVLMGPATSAPLQIHGNFAHM